MKARSAAPMTVRIAPMRRRHLRSVLRIESQVYPRPWTLGLYLGELALPEDRRVYLVARAQGQVVGHAGLMFAATDGHVTTVAVDPAWQGRGVAANLLVVLFDEAIRLGASDLTLEVRASNGRAQRLYEWFGFEAAGVRRGYYSDDGEDAVVMWARHVRSVEYRSRLDRITAELSARGLRAVADVPAVAPRRGRRGA